jgi:hypothetical protein
MNTRGNFKFNGRYTLREICNVWYIYDREKETIIQRCNNVTFTKAERELIVYKAKCGDAI